MAAPPAVSPRKAVGKGITCSFPRTSTGAQESFSVPKPRYQHGGRSQSAYLFGVAGQAARWWPLRRVKINTRAQNIFFFLLTLMATGRTMGAELGTGTGDCLATGSVRTAGRAPYGGGEVCGIGDWQLYGALDIGSWQARDLLFALATMHPPEVEVVLAKKRPAIAGQN